MDCGVSLSLFKYFFFVPASELDFWSFQIISPFLVQYEIVLEASLGHKAIIMEKA